MRLTSYFIAAFLISTATITRGESSFSFAFLTDIHLQPERDADKGFLKAIDTVNSLAPDFVLTGGDLIMDALYVTHGRADSLFKLYKETSANITVPVYNTPGNHEYFGLSDKYDSTHADYAENMYKRYFGDNYYSFDHKGWHFIVLDAVDVNTNSEVKSAYVGHIDDEQLEWLKTDIANVNVETPIVMVTHIPFLNASLQIRGGAPPANLIVDNAIEVLTIMGKHNLKLVLQGHVHNLEEISLNNRVKFITGGAVCAKWWKGPFLKNTAMEMQEGFLMIHINGEEIDWDYIDYGWEAKKKKK